MANFCCPIETEPRTLNQGQLNQAREIAFDIVKNKELDEATAMFNEVDILHAPLAESYMDLKPGEGIKERTIFDPTPSHKDGGESVIKTCCQCSCTGTTPLIDDSPQRCRIKESVSAPF